MVLNRPSTRRKGRNRNEMTLNLVPLLDALVTLVIFLLFTMSFLNFVGIESIVPVVSSKDMNKRIDQKPLQLTVSIRENDMEVWSPFYYIKPQTFPNLSDGQPDIISLHEALLQIKEKFPTEKKVILVPHKQISYDILIQVMDAVREYEGTDPPLFAANPDTGVSEQLTRLFPEVIFGNLLGDI